MHNTIITSDSNNDNNDNDDTTTNEHDNAMHKDATYPKTSY